MIGLVIVIDYKLLLTAVKGVCPPDRTIFKLILYLDNSDVRAGVTGVASRFLVPVASKGRVPVASQYGAVSAPQGVLGFAMAFR